MPNAITVVTPPASRPVSSADAKLYLRVDTTADDDLIGDMIDAATEAMERYLRRTLINTTLKLIIDRWPLSRGRKWWDGVRDGAITEVLGGAQYVQLPAPPLVSITSVYYYDLSDTQQLWAASNYYADTASGRLALKQTGVIPSSMREGNAMEITYVAGYGSSASSVPAPIVNGIKALIARMYDNRGCACEVDGEVEAYVRQYRIMDRL